VLAELDRDVRTVLGRLRQHERFAAFLRQTGQEGTFDQAAQRVLDRVSGNQLQNLRGAETPYQFFEIPFPPNAPIRNAQVHILGEEQAPARGFDRENAAVAIDLETTRLGGLWISLTIHQGDCRCWIRAQTPEAVRAIDAHASELAERLKVTGYRGVKVSVSLWRGDRVTEVVNLLAHFRGVNLEA
jgi:flagellar hook-length control protein FliK